MRSARHHPPGKAGTHPGFTLLEILLVLLLLSVLGGLLTQNTARLVEAANYIPPERHFRELVAEARLLAAETRGTVWLDFDNESGEFSLVEVRPEPRGEDEPQALEGPEPRSYPEVTIHFYPLVAFEDGDDLRQPRYAEEPAPRLEFRPDGFNTPARITFTFKEADATELTLDAFSYGPLPLRNDLDRYPF